MFVVGKIILNIMQNKSSFFCKIRSQFEPVFNDVN